jgi:8-oxo-dGTP pyrophosphatase MutT (NUDIX family)
MTVTLRSAAVLVLVIDRPEGPHVLLTKRTADLADDPGQMVFPGGATEHTDHGPVSTALREAQEETGLDPTSVEIIGLLPPYALIDSGFLTTPVLAWSTAPAFTSATNLAEVETVVEVSLPGGVHPQEPRTTLGAETLDRADAPYGRMTAALLDMLANVLGTRGGQLGA